MQKTMNQTKPFPIPPFELNIKHAKDDYSKPFPIPPFELNIKYAKDDYSKPKQTNFNSTKIYFIQLAIHSNQIPIGLKRCR